MSSAARPLPASAEPGHVAEYHTPAEVIPIGRARQVCIDAASQARVDASLRTEILSELRALAALD